MSDFIIYNHEMVRFINKLIEDDKSCNCNLISNISNDDLLKINEFLYCIVESCFLGEDFSKDANALREKIRDIANCHIKKQN